MLQIDHVYEFFYENIFKDFTVLHLPNGVPKINDVTLQDIHLFTNSVGNPEIFFYDQEPIHQNILDEYFKLNADDSPMTLVSSEYSTEVDQYPNTKLYYFFHGFAALDWYRGYYAMNYNKPVNKSYKNDFISYNRIINNDRSYRIYFVSLLSKFNLLNQGLVSFGVTDDINETWHDEVANPNTKMTEVAKLSAERYLTDINKLVIDKPNIPGSASASIPRTIGGHNVNNDMPNVDCFWHIVTETVFYYDKLHLTEKIFKPIVSKQPFMLLGAPGNLAYLRRYGFKTFDGIISESYDHILNDDARIEAVVKELNWYCNLSTSEKQDIINEITPIVEYNFHHFYGEFKHIITQELLDNCKSLFKELGYNDNTIAYNDIYHVLTA